MVYKVKLSNTPPHARLVKAESDSKQKPAHDLTIDIKLDDTDFFKDFLNIFKGIIENEKVPLDVKNDAKEKINKLIIKYKS